MYAICFQSTIFMILLFHKSNPQLFQHCCWLQLPLGGNPVLQWSSNALPLELLSLRTLQSVKGKVCKSDMTHLITEIMQPFTYFFIQVFLGFWEKLMQSTPMHVCVAEGLKDVETLLIIRSPPHSFHVGITFCSQLIKVLITSLEK